MVLMDLKADNLLCFNEFHANFSYPKRIVNSYIEDEFLSNRPNFRYRKVNLIMGSNATGKTSLGRLIMKIFNFMSHKNLDSITSLIADKKKEASFSTDFVVPRKDSYLMYRVCARFLPAEDNTYTSNNTVVSVKSTSIRKRDNYEICAERLDIEEDSSISENYVTELEKIMGLSWYFIFPADFPTLGSPKYKNEEMYLKVLEIVLKILDPAIVAVERLDSVENSFVIRMKDCEVIVQDGRPAKKEVLSTGTVSGIEISMMLTSMIVDDGPFYYCDEKFSYVNSDIERAILATMINKLKPDTQLFFTSHNYDIFDMPLPKHSFNLLRKSITDSQQKITIVNVGDYLKKNTDSVRTAVENDLFLSAPSLELLDDIDDL